MRRRWPVTNRDRAYAFAALIAVLTAPQALLILFAASSMGIANAIVFLLFVLVSIAFPAMLFSRQLVAQRSANGLYLLLLTLHVVSVLALPPWAYGLLAVSFMPFALRAAERGFDHFTRVTEKLSIGQLA